jgi:DNA-binding NarL/FixJ family response regulator
MPIRVIIADYYTVVRAGLRSMLAKNTRDIKIVGEASDGIDLLELAKNNPADVYIIDLTMPALNGIETTVRLLRSRPKSKVIILSIYQTDVFIEKAFNSGARGYILKDITVEDLIRAVREVHQGRYFFSPTISNFIMNGYIDNIKNNRKFARMSNLTSREIEILQLIGEGATIKEIAAKLYLSIYTIATHKKNLMQKLNIHKNTDLVRLALREGIARI